MVYNKLDESLRMLVDVLKITIRTVDKVRKMIAEKADSSKSKD